MNNVEIKEGKKQNIQDILELIKNKNKAVDIFFKNMTTNEFMDILDEKYPVNLKYLEDLVERVWYKYPLVSKADIAIVVNGFFGALRYALISNKVIVCDKLLYFTKLRLRKRIRHEGTRRRIEVPFYIIARILIKMDKGIKKYARS
jgi:nucleoid DNA-binding protein